jgi:hypothetical protein
VALFLQVLGTILQPVSHPVSSWQDTHIRIVVATISGCSACRDCTSSPVRNKQETDTRQIASVACSRLVLSLHGLYTTPRQNTTIQDFHARSGTLVPASRSIRLSVLRSHSGGKPLLNTSDSMPDEERRRYAGGTIPSPVLEEDDIDPSRQTESFETNQHPKDTSHAI